MCPFPESSVQAVTQLLTRSSCRALACCSDPQIEVSCPFASVMRVTHVTTRSCHNMTSRASVSAVYAVSSTPRLLCQGVQRVSLILEGLGRPPSVRDSVVFFMSLSASLSLCVRTSYAQPSRKKKRESFSCVSFWFCSSAPRFKCTRVCMSALQQRTRCQLF